MLEALNAIAQLIGYLFLAAFALLTAIGAWFKYGFTSEVSPEAKQMAKEIDPNNPVSRAASELVFENVINEVRELQPEEAIRADPQPLTYFDWSAENATQEDIEHILSVLQEAGYHSHPFPEYNFRTRQPHWSRERAGVWRSPPDWCIVEYNDQGRQIDKEQIELPLPDEWSPGIEA